MKRLFTLCCLFVTTLAFACSASPESGDETLAEQTGEPSDQANESSTSSDDGESRANESAEVEEEEEDLPVTADPNAPADVAAPPTDAQVTASGLASKVLVEGSGDANPTPTSVVRVHYTGWTTDGVKFDSSVDRGEPAEFPLDKVIPGWTEGVALMKVGEKRRLWIPVELAYNNRPDRPKGMLVFDVELLAIVPQ